MNAALNLIFIIASIIIITYGVNNLSEPSNLQVAIGVAEIILGLLVLYFPTKKLFKKL
ncbi:hypothetical protein [Pedobacter rhodius]|uniref:Gliding motility protein GldL n=1 Tax=Pedobacter rhodius TaxID=3004098 RepID=A0ABT4L1S9_9SPHI|nr:hypothetical protein [Pedobacter sp. SJ11]MCZ4225138.1 hypothetical protein [Pedobacter sp. SJ11]